MEVLCNLVWVAVTIALWSSWHVRRRHARTASILPAIAVQLISLAALTAILLPVISITDDLQAANNPAEVERSAGKRDHLFRSNRTIMVRPASLRSSFQFCVPVS